MLTQCENCGTALRGPYCSLCGQSAHNPMHDFKHALEEVAESFWHVDGRVVRTLKELWTPGKVPADYIHGHRVRYVAPLRLFLVFSLLVFFVLGHTVHVRQSVNVQSKWVTEAATGHADGAVTFNGSKYDGVTRKVKTGYPAFVDDFINSKIRKGNDNIHRYMSNWQEGVAAVMHAVPTALLGVLPLFAVFMWVFYFFRKVPYLQHLVTLLYGHVWIFMLMLVWTAMNAFLVWLAGSGSSVLGIWDILTRIIWLSVPVYVIVAQKRIYGQSWFRTIAKFIPLSFIYCVLMTLGLSYAILAGITG